MAPLRRAPAARRSSRPWTLPPAQKWPPAPCTTTAARSSGFGLGDAERLDPGGDDLRRQRVARRRIADRQHERRAASARSAAQKAWRRAHGRGARRPGHGPSHARNCVTRQRAAGRSERAQARQREVERLVLLGEAEAHDALVEAVARRTPTAGSRRRRSRVVSQRQKSASPSVADGRVVDALEVAALARQQRAGASRARPARNRSRLRW